MDRAIEMVWDRRINLHVERQRERSDGHRWGRQSTAVGVDRRICQEKGAEPCREKRERSGKIDNGEVGYADNIVMRPARVCSDRRGQL